MTDARYCPERVLPAAPYLPGQGPHPAILSEDVGRDPPWRGDASTLAAQRVYLWGVDLYNHGFYWEAHESWEELWRSTGGEDVSRDFLQGLIQCAAAILKSSLGQRRGFESLADKGLARLDRVLAAGHPVFAGIDLREFRRGFCSYRESTRDDSNPSRVPRIVLQAEYLARP